MNNKAKIITISSGKGGVGKSSSAVNLALLLSQQGFKTCLFDADANLANINIMLKLVPEFTLEHVVTGEKTLDDITLHKAGLQIIPGYSGLSDFVTLTDKQRQNLLKALQELKTKCDYLIIDNPAGISKAILSYIKFSDINIIIITPEPTSLTDAFSLIRTATKNINRKKYQIIVNNVKNKAVADNIFKRFSMAVEKYISCPISYLGHIVSDELVTSSICLQNPVVLQHPTSNASSCFNEISEKLITLRAQAIKKSIQKSPVNISPRKQPDFSTSATTLNNEPPQQKPPSTAAQPTLTTLTKELVQSIENKDIKQEALKEAILEINNTYSKRFDGSANNLASEINKIVNTNNSISESSLRNLLMTLHSLYQDQYNQPTKNNSEQASTEDKLKQESIAVAIKHLQQENLSLLNNQLKQDEQDSHLAHRSITHKKVKKADQDLLDSIRYASMTDK